MRRSLNDLSDLQKLIMETVWESGQVSAREVQKRLKKKKDYAYTTVNTMLQRLEKEGWLKHRVEGRTYIYLPVHSRSKEALRSFKRLIDRVFQGNTRLLVQSLIEEEQLSDADLMEIRKLIDAKRGERKDE